MAPYSRQSFFGTASSTIPISLSVAVDSRSLMPNVRSLHVWPLTILICYLRRISTMLSCSIGHRFAITRTLPRDPNTNSSSWCRTSPPSGDSPVTNCLTTTISLTWPWPIGWIRTFTGPTAKWRFCQTPRRLQRRSKRPNATCPAITRPENPNWPSGSYHIARRIHGESSTSICSNNTPTSTSSESAANHFAHSTNSTTATNASKSTTSSTCHWKIPCAVTTSRRNSLIYSIETSSQSFTEPVITRKSPRRIRTSMPSNTRRNSWPNISTCSTKTTRPITNISGGNLITSKSLPFLNQNANELQWLPI